MAAKPSAATERAVARVAAGESAYAAAKAEGIALSTIYRALRKTASAVMQHKLDKLDGHFGERVGVIEAVVDHSLPGGLQRRATDRPGWGVSSDVGVQRGI